jgi:type I restriction enzyme R subunit
VTEVKPSVPLSNLLRDVGMGLTTDDVLRSVATRMVRLNNKLNDSERAEFERTAGQPMTAIVAKLRTAIDLNAQVAVATETAGGEPDETAIAAAREALVEEAIVELRRSEVRQKLESLQMEISEQFIHIGGHDELVSAGFIASPEEAQGVLETWRTFIEEHQDEYLALKVFFSQPYRRRPSLRDIKDLAAAISRPPFNLTPERVWTAYEKLDADRVKGHGGKLDADLVRLIRYTLEQDDELIPHEDIVRMRFDFWVSEQQASGREFSEPQMRWLTMVRDHIARSMNFDPTEDYDFPPFSDMGGAVTAYQLFGKELTGVVDELNEALAAA